MTATWGPSGQGIWGAKTLALQDGETRRRNPACLTVLQAGGWIGCFLQLLAMHWSSALGTSTEIERFEGGRNSVLSVYSNEFWQVPDAMLELSAL